MYHIIKQNDRDLLLCSGAMEEADYIMVKKEFGIDKDQIKFVPQFVISERLKSEAPTTEQLKDLLSKMPCVRRSLLQKVSFILLNIYGVRHLLKLLK